MLFQTLDDKKNCVAVCVDQKLIKDEIPENLTKTWSYSAFLKGKNIDYAQLYVEGRNLIDVCPDHLKENWSYINDRLKSFYLSFKEAKVSLRENCFFDLVPEKFLIEYCYLKDEITNHILTNHERPKNYEFLREMTEFLTDLKYEDLNLNLDNLSPEEAIEFRRKTKNKKNYVDYDLFGSVTGRLSETKNTFPILHLNKNLRSAIEPKNDWFVEFDMNGAELRTSLGLLNMPQPEGDIYQWISSNALNNLNRTDTKKVTIEWLYNSHNPVYNQQKDALNKLFKKDALKAMYWVDGFIHTGFGRKIECDEHHAIPYLNQSTFIDLFHRQTLKLNKKLTKKTKIAFLIHDCLVLDLADEEKSELPELIEELSNTKFGKFPVNVKIGNNYGNMKKVKIKV